MYNVIHKMFAEEVLYTILNHLPTIETLCNLRYMCCQFERIARGILYNRHIFLEELTISPFSGKTVFKEETNILHRILNSGVNIRCSIAIFEIGEIQRFVCLTFSSPDYSSGRGSGSRSGSRSVSYPRMNDTNVNLKEILCLVPSLQIISFEILQESKDVIKVSPQYVRIEKINHIQTSDGIEIAVRTEIHEFSNFKTPMTIRFVELVDLKDKKILAPFAKNILPLSSSEEFVKFKDCLESETITSRHYADATRIKFDEFYDYAIIRNFAEIIDLSKGS